MGDHLGEPGGGTDDDAGVPVERAVGLAALRTLVDVAGDGGDAVRGLVLLGELALAGELDRADRDGRTVGVELVQRLLGGDDARLVEPFLDGLLEVEHGGAVGDLDLDGERGLGAGDDGGGHGWTSVSVRSPRGTTKVAQLLHPSATSARGRTRLTGVVEFPCELLAQTVITHSYQQLQQPLDTSEYLDQSDYRRS